MRPSGPHLGEQLNGVVFNLLMDGVPVLLVIRAASASIRLASMTFSAQCTAEQVNGLKHHAEMQAPAADFRVALSGARSAASNRVSPFTIRPAFGVSGKFRQRSRVVLPEPDEPIMASACRVPEEKLMSCSTLVGPKLFSMFCTSRIGIAARPYTRK